MADPVRIPRHLLRTAEEIRTSQIEAAHQMVAREATEDMRVFLERRFADAVERLEAFRRLFDTGPQKAFERSHDAFRAAAEHSILSSALNILRPRNFPGKGHATPSLHDLLNCLERQGPGIRFIAEARTRHRAGPRGELPAVGVARALSRNPPDHEGARGRRRPALCSQ